MILSYLHCIEFFCIPNNRYRLPLDFNLNCCDYILADLNNYFTMKCNKLYLYNWNYLCIKFCATLVIIPFDIY